MKKIRRVNTMSIKTILLVCSLLFCSGKRLDELDRFIIACHTTDFECFKRQFRTLRDCVLMRGNDHLAIGPYEPYIFRYDNTTCVKLSGLEESELVGVRMDSDNKEYSMILELPLKIHQVNDTGNCVQPDHEFKRKHPNEGPLRRFTGNATVEVTYPYRLIKKNSSVHMILEDENLDVILDIPDLSHFNKQSKLEAQLFSWSEWAYDVMQHIDAAQHFILPVTSQFRVLTDRVPIERLILLYPDEKYIDLQFTYSEPVNKDKY